MLVCLWSGRNVSYLNPSLYLMSISWQERGWIWQKRKWKMLLIWESLGISVSCTVFLIYSTKYIHSIFYNHHRIPMQADGKRTTNFYLVRNSKQKHDTLMRYLSDVEKFGYFDIRAKSSITTDACQLV